MNIDDLDLEVISLSEDEKKSFSKLQLKWIEFWNKEVEQQS